MIGLINKNIFKDLKIKQNYKMYGLDYIKRLEWKVFNWVKLKIKFEFFSLWGNKIKIIWYKVKM